MKLRKYTDGHVIQVFSEAGDCVSQEFIAGSQTEYEDEVGAAVDNPEYNYFPFHMVDPEELVKLEAIHSLVQEAQRGDTDALDEVLELVEDLREKFF